MRFLLCFIFLCILLLLSSQTVFAIPSATTEQCAMWETLIKQDIEKYRQARSPEKKAIYWEQIRANKARRRAGRCRDKVLNRET